MLFYKIPIVKNRLVLSFIVAFGKPKTTLESRTPPEGGAVSLHVEPSSRKVRAGHPQTSNVV